jgi:hypothetical protein
MVASSGAALNQLRVVIEIGLTGSGYLRTDTKLVGSFDKAGPVALCLTSSIVFMIISLIAARI